MGVFFMRESVKKLLRDYWLVGFIVMLSLMVAEIFGALTGWWGVTNFEERIGAGDLLRSLILCIGGIGGAYGLHLATKRQKTFSEQVQVQVNQDFNDRLGRGVELLANKDVSMRSAGISVLEDLANNASEAQKSIVANIIYDFFCDKMAIKSGDDYNKAHSVEDRQDLQNALDFLVGLPSYEREKSLQKRIINGRLDLRKLKFIHLHFTNKLLENIDFSQSYFYESEFKNDTIMNVSFYDAKIRSSIFGMEHIAYSLTSIVPNIPPKKIILGCDFGNTEFSNTDFYNMNIESTNFSHIQFFEGDFHDVEFLGGLFCFKSNMGISSDLDLPCFIGTDLADSDFNFSYDLDPNKFFKFCYAPIDEQGNILDFIGESRAYEFVDFMRIVFVESDKLWSGQPVEEWVTVEKAQWKLEQIKSLPSWMDNKKDVDKAKYELEIAVALLHKSQEVFRIPNKTPQLIPTNKPNPKERSSL